jgi:hypothetical protein
MGVKLRDFEMVGNLALSNRGVSLESENTSRDNTSRIHQDRNNRGNTSRIDQDRNIKNTSRYNTSR